MVIESGLKVLPLPTAPPRDTVGTNYLKLVSTTVASTLAELKRIRGVSGDSDHQEP